MEEIEQGVIEGDVLEFSHIKRKWNAETSMKQLEDQIFTDALKDIQRDQEPVVQIDEIREEIFEHNRPGSITKSDFSFKDHQKPDSEVSSQADQEIDTKLAVILRKNYETQNQRFVSFADV